MSGTSTSIFSAGDLLAWLIVLEGRPTAFIAGEFVHYPRHTVFNVTFAAGRLQSSVKEIEQLCNLVKLGGAKYVEAHCDDRRARRHRRHRCLRRDGGLANLTLRAP